MTYDGVFAEQGERVRGEGSLSLSSDMLGLEKVSIIVIGIKKSFEKNLVKICKDLIKALVGLVRY